MKVKDLPSTTTLADDDLFYVVDDSEGTNGGRKIKKSDLENELSGSLTPAAHGNTHVEGGSDAIPNATTSTGGLQSATDKTKLDGIESGATADQTDAEIKTAYENNADTNAFTDTEQTKLAGIESGAQVNQSDSEIKTQYENNADTNAFTDAEQTKLAGIEAGAQVNQTDSEIKSQYEANADTNAFTDAEKTKLANVEAAGAGGAFHASLWKASVGDGAAPPIDMAIEWNQLAQATSTELFIDYNDLNGADLSSFMGASIVGSLIRVQNKDNAGQVQLFEVTSITDNATYYTFGVTGIFFLGGNIANDQEVLLTFITAKNIPKHGSQHITGGDDPIPVVTGSADGLMISSDKTKLDGIESGATADQTDAEIKTAYENNADTNAFTDAEQTKLAGIEAGATGDQSDSEIKTAYENNANTNAFTDAEQTKLSGIEAGAEVNQTDSEIKTQYENNADTNAFTDAEQSKLSGIEANATADAASGVAPPDVAGSGSAGTDTATYANANHTHGHGNQAGGALHAEATESVAGFLPAADKVKLNDLAFGWVQYQSDTDFTQVNAGFTQMTDWTTDLDSFANGQITRVDGTTFRVEQDCTVEISYGIEIDVSGNNTGAQARVEINATQLDRSLALLGGTRANNAESSHLQRTFRVDLTDQDLITFSIGNREGGGSSVTALSQNFTTMMIKVVRLL